MLGIVQKQRESAPAAVSILRAETHRSNSGLLPNSLTHSSINRKISFLTLSCVVRSLTSLTRFCVKARPEISRCSGGPQLFTRAPASCEEGGTLSVEPGRGRRRRVELTVREKSWTLALRCCSRFCRAATQLRALWEGRNVSYVLLASRSCYPTPRTRFLIAPSATEAREELRRQQLAGRAPPRAPKLQGSRSYPSGVPKCSRGVCISSRRRAIAALGESPAGSPNSLAEQQPPP